jgi:hypothetical protein
MTMYRDPIVEEVRRHREARAAKFGFNIRAIVEDARSREASSGHPVVDLSKEGKPRKVRRVHRGSLRKNGEPAARR